MNFKIILVLFAALFFVVPVIISMFMGFPIINILPNVAIYSAPKNKAFSYCPAICEGKRYTIACYDEFGAESCNYLCIGKLNTACPR